MYSSPPQTPTRLPAGAFWGVEKVWSALFASAALRDEG